MKEIPKDWPLSYYVRPIHKKVFIKMIEPETETNSGIILTGEKKSNKGMVLSIGEEVKGVKAGEVVLFNEYSLKEVELESGKYAFLEEEDILATEI